LRGQCKDACSELFVMHAFSRAKCFKTHDLCQAKIAIFAFVVNQVILPEALHSRVEVHSAAYDLYIPGNTTCQSFLMTANFDWLVRPRNKLLTWVG